MSNRKKRASAWFYQTLYRDEQIRPRPAASYEPVPDEILAMRSLERGEDALHRSREEVFIQQAEQMAIYEDDYLYDRDVVRYFPTYQSLTDRELRGYFSWRTKWRRGEREKTNLSYAFLYIYELLNQIGVSDPVDGFEKLRAFQREYSLLDAKVFAYLKRWLWDYVVFYRLDPVLLADWPEIEFDRNLEAFRQPALHSDEELFQAVLFLSSYRLDRSKLYLLEPELTKAVTTRVLRKMDAYYTAHRKQKLSDFFFGPQVLLPVTFFENAVFYEKKQRTGFSYSIDALRTYQYRDQHWTVIQPDCAPERSRKLGELIRTVDSMLRESTGCGNAIQPGLSTKWICRLIAEKIHDCLCEREEKEARRVTIDYSRLATIRDDASVTREKLISDEEREEDDISPDRNMIETPLSPPECPLDEKERRLLHAILYGGDLTWVQIEGLLLSVLVDSINDKLFDLFGDTVLLYDGEPEVIEDYAEQLKEMVKP